MEGNTQSLGLNHRTADQASITQCSDCARVDLRWNNGAHVYMVHDTRAEAEAHLNRLGFYAVAA